MPDQVIDDEQAVKGAGSITDAEALLWKRRYQTSCDAWSNNDHKDRCERIIKYLHNDFSFVPGNSQAFFNHFFVSLKTLLPMVVANNPFVAVSPENDIVYEYDDQGQPRLDEFGQPVTHNISKTAQTIQGLLKKRLKYVVNVKNELRLFLRDAIVFNRGVFLVGHTLNTEYSGAFNSPTFHAYVKRVSPRKIKRQAGTTRIDEGTYCFYEYELPVSHLKKNQSYDQKLLAGCTQEILEEVKIDDYDNYEKENLSGVYDDVKFIKLHNAYDFETGKILVFGKGQDKPLKIIQPDYTFKNPFTEFIPNETFQPDQKEPISDLMMVENIVLQVQEIISKVIRHVKNFNTGWNIEQDAIGEKERKRIEKSRDRAFWVFNRQALSGNKVQPRVEIPLGGEPYELIRFLFDYIDKMIAVYNFQQGGSTQDDETATKTQAKVQTAQFKSGDMSDIFMDAANQALNKYTEVLIKTTDTNEVIECVGDAGEVEYLPFNGDEAQRGQYYCEIDLQTLGKVNEDVKMQQALKFYEILKSDPDPVIQQKFDKLKLVEKIAKSLNLGNDGIIRKIPDTKGMDEASYREYLKQQMLKAKKVAEQIMAGAEPLPPAPDDDDDIHLTEYLSRAQKLRQEAAANPDPLAQQQAQVIISQFVAQAQIHIERKREKAALESQPGPLQMEGMSNPMPQGAPRQDVSNQPPVPGRMGMANGGMVQ